jgi:hypothetical protein
VLGGGIGVVLHELLGDFEAGSFQLSFVVSQTKQSLA